jgi:decaprenylphospho-beta-D-ribofuranose 2-oxidase
LTQTAIFTARILVVCAFCDRTKLPDAPSPLLTGWGRTAASRAAVLARPTTDEAVRAALLGANGRGVIPRGLGRAYGDAAQNAGGLVVDTTGLASGIVVDAERALVTVDAGVSLDTLIGRLLPEGLFIRVSPGTRFVTVGGAIAADVHGKNHHVDGAFCTNVVSFDLLTPAGDVLTASRESNADVFWATAGGMGLTGVVLRATLELDRVESAWMLVDTERAADLDDALARFTDRDEAYRYSVAWIDCLARGRHLGRSVLMRANPARRADLAESTRRSPLAVPRRLQLRTPPWVPGGLVNRRSTAAFNEAYYRAAPRDERGRLQSLDRYLYPLDSISDWNRLYGRHGFIQYQFVVPLGEEDTLRAVLERLSAAGCAAFLAVLKRFGREEGLISFPMPGWTLALDVPASFPGLGPLLDALDVLVAESGGRVYLAKDARMRPEILERMYPKLDEWRGVQARLDPDGRMQSDLARRLLLVPRSVA